MQQGAGAIEAEPPRGQRDADDDRAERLGRGQRAYQDRRDVILLHPDDIERLGFTEEQRVTVRSETGSMPNILVRSFPEIRAGNALMYYPEANVLVPRYADPQSKTPAFKSILVTVETLVPQLPQVVG